MKIFKFGGASVKDANAVTNMFKVLQATAEKDLVIVVSAMGKTTNALEEVVHAYFDDPKNLAAAIANSYSYHLDIIAELFESQHKVILNVIEGYFDDLKSFLERNKSPNYNFVYDQVVSTGELLSTAIISHYLEKTGYKNRLLDIRNHLKTTNNYREGKIKWDDSQASLIKAISPKGFTVTQGFIASDENGFTTTLGREGSDYTAAILAYCLNAKSVTIWKDVPGVLSADPRYFKDALLLNNISYQEAIELSFYGATVIHPKTLQPLQHKEIPLYVKSFVDPLAAGTCVTKGELLEPLTPCFITKHNQLLISLSSLDFSFMIEENIGEVFKLLGRHKMKVDLIQNSAISFSVCIDDKYGNLEDLLIQLKQHFKVAVHKNVQLFTIRHFTEKALQTIEEGKNVLLKQVTENTVQLVTQ
ncbi:aspartate kinase [Leeuwenhoekiella sp. A16]|uniref:aspartate kinase n=1 Tax=unclassified Leeuwenhoekiella TaxID=2615029 RepID=UPI003A7F8F42